MCHQGLYYKSRKLRKHSGAHNTALLCVVFRKKLQFFCRDLYKHRDQLPIMMIQCIEVILYHTIQPCL